MVVERSAKYRPAFIARGAMGHDLDAEVRFGRRLLASAETQQIPSPRKLLRLWTSPVVEQRGNSCYG